MNVILLMEIAFGVLLLIAVRLLTLPKVKGWVGEWLMVLLLKKLDHGRYRILNNVYLPKPDGATTQIDHIVVSIYGVFVIETKNYCGWIFADANSKVWTQCIRAKGFRKPIKNTFQNPIHQNYAHLCALEECTGVPKSVMRSVIAFSAEATFKTARPDGVCYMGGVVGYIKSFSTAIIKEEQVDEIVSAILEWQMTLAKQQVAAHVDNLKARHEGVSANASAPLCPRCGASMIRRTRKSDGKSFYGCSYYPKCKGIVNIND